MKVLFSRTLLIALGVAVVLCAALGYGGYRYYLLHTAFSIAHDELSSYEYGINQLREKLSAAQAMNSDLLVLLQARQQEKDAYSTQVQQLASTVGMLDKLSKTDKELLQKYSSVYFLNENYVPSKLSQIDTSLLYNSKTDAWIHTDVMPYTEKLIQASKTDNVPLLILSAYRSFGTQAVLKSSYKVTYGAGTANSFSADQGYSEHQLGSAIDFTTKAVGDDMSGFGKSAGYQWLTDHAYQFGFILSYPKGNKYFQFEPWHWRFVGVELATKLYTEQKYFYDLSQREIDQYLIKIFD